MGCGCVGNCAGRAEGAGDDMIERYPDAPNIHISPLRLCVQLCVLRCKFMCANVSTTQTYTHQCVCTVYRVWVSVCWNTVNQTQDTQHCFGFTFVAFMVTMTLWLMNSGNQFFLSLDHRASRLRATTSVLIRFVLLYSSAHHLCPSLPPPLHFIFVRLNKHTEFEIVD